MEFHINTTLKGNSPSEDFQNQVMYWIARDGKGGITERNITMAYLDHFTLINTKLAILFTSQFSACLVMAIVLLVLTSRKNYRQPVFILNLLSLIFGFLRMLFQCFFLLGPWSTFYNMYSWDYSDVPKSSYRISVATAIFPLLMLITVSASLVVQAHAVSRIMDRKPAIALTIMSVLVVLITVAFRFGLMITNSQAILNTTSLNRTAYLFKKGSLFTSTSLIWWFSLIFCYKLINTVITRRQNGWKRYSTLRVLAIMSGCTMVIPSIFAILEYPLISMFPEAGTLTLTSTALLLPLSTIWARMSDQAEESSLRESIQRGGGSASSSRNSRPNSRYGSKSTTVVGSDDRKGSVAPLNTATTMDTVIERSSTRDSTEMEIEKMGVRVDRSYSINEGY